MRSWRVKATAQRLFSAVPGGHRLNYLFQRRITHGLPVSDASLDAAIEIAARHVENLRRHSSTPIESGQFFEFGAGWDLHVPQILWCLGVDNQIVVDIRPLLRPELVRDIAARLATRPRHPAFVRVPDPGDGPFDLPGHLVRLGIDYRAPADARATGLPTGSIDFATSTNTLEHIPPDDIAAIVRELARILAPDGRASFQIDYKDHYSYFDRSISKYSYLTHDERAWRRWNPSLHFQNRLRHDDHLRLLTANGLVVLEEQPAHPSDADLETLRQLALAPPYRGIPLDRLGITEAVITLAPSATR